MSTLRHFKNLRNYAAVFGVFIALLAVTPAMVLAAGPTVGIQFSDNGCGNQVGPPKLVADGTSAWASDTNAFNPDCVQVYISKIDPSTDFRVGVQMSDQEGCSGQLSSTHDGVLRFTPWASAGGGWSGWVSQFKGFDPDCGRLVVETRPRTSLLAD